MSQDSPVRLVTEDYTQVSSLTLSQQLTACAIFTCIPLMVLELVCQESSVCQLELLT